MNRLDRGEGRAGCIFYLLVLGVVLFLAYKFIPQKIAVAQFKDQITEMVIHNQRAKPEAMKREIVFLAEELELPVDKKQIEVKKTRKKTTVTVNFDIVLDLLVTDYVWRQNVEVDRDVFLN